MSAGDRTLWSELKALYTQLNTEREKFSMSTVEVPENSESLMKASSIEDLSNAIQAMTSNDQLKDIADTSSISIPNQNDQIRYTPVSLLSNKITAIGDVTPCTLCFGTTFHGTSFFGTAASKNTSGFFSSTASRNLSGFYTTNFFQSNFYNTTASNNRSNFYTDTSSSNAASFWKPAHGCTSFFTSNFFSTTASRNSSFFTTTAQSFRSFMANVNGKV